MMKIIRIEDPPSCSNCEYADEYIPYYIFPFFTPRCSKGHGVCSEDKICEDYKYIYEICGHCQYITKERDDFKCNLHGNIIFFNKKTCEDFSKIVKESLD